MNAWLQALMMGQQFNRPNPQTLAPGNFSYGAAGPAPFRTGPNNALRPEVSQQLLSITQPGGFRGYADDNTFYGDVSPTGNPDWTYVGEHKYNGPMNIQQKAGPSALFNQNTNSTKIWKRNTPAEQKPAAAPAQAAPSQQAQSTGPSNNAPGNPQLQIPGINVRLTGEQVGIKPAESTARKAKATSKGSSRLTIPRSSGASGLNLGM